jgi:hypothetical protein
MRFFVSIILVWLLVSDARSQQWPFEFWHEGKAVLESGDTLTGQLKYDLQQDLLQHRNTQSTAEVFTARKVLFFEIFDNSVRKYRQFFSLPYALNGGYKAPVFFELLEEGKMTLLAREAVEYRTFTNPYGFGSFTRMVLVNYYFFLKDNGNIEPFLGKKRADLLELMGKRKEQVQDFIKQNRLDIEDKYDLVQIIEYYNSL